MFFSPSSQQALRALIYLARQKTDAPVLVRDIARAESIPHPFLSKLLHTLRNRGIVRSTRGPGGGYSLARPPERIVLTDVVETFEGQQATARTCILGLDECNERNPCALHERWKIFRKEFEERISSMTLRDVSRSVARARPLAGSGSNAPRKRSPRTRHKDRH